MRLLVSVRSATEAAAALAGGADIIDAKNPAAGALGPVSRDALGEICRCVDSRAPVSAALGDAVAEEVLEEHASACAALGVWFVKVGFAGTNSIARATSLLAAAVRGAAAGSDRRDRAAGVVAVAYGDAAHVGSLLPFAVLDVAARMGANGVLLDTAEKNGPGIRLLLTDRQICDWVDRAHLGGLQVALAGKLTAADLLFVRETGADIVGVRSAACDGGRNGSILSSKVRLLAAQR
jgi:(5-formylfuran-3-yl)methyl phosphate synthase